MPLNVHRREIAASAETVGAVLGTLATTSDRAWPAGAWPPMRFPSEGTVVGEVGGHGPVGYRVAHVEPGRSVTFEFTDRPQGLHGRHQFVVQPTGDGRCILWHLLEAELTGPMLVAWPLAIRWLHDALLEDALDKVQSAAEQRPLPASRWPLHVRLLRRLLAPRARSPRRSPSLG